MASGTGAHVNVCCCCVCVLVARAARAALECMLQRSTEHGNTVQDGLKVSPVTGLVMLDDVSLPATLGGAGTQFILRWLCFSEELDEFETAVSITGILPTAELVSVEQLAPGVPRFEVVLIRWVPGML